MIYKYAFALLLLAGLAFAIQPAEDWDLGATGKYAQAMQVNYTTEGGNVTEINLTSNISTEKWAGFWGNVTGQIVLAPNNADMFYTWDWNSTLGGKVCAIAAPSGFDWVGLELLATGDIDAVWDFVTADTDSETNTMNETCAITIAGIPVPATISALTGLGNFETCAVGDGGSYTSGDKENIAFCVEIAPANLFNGQTGDYELLVATNETAGEYENYFFWLELN